MFTQPTSAANRPHALAAQEMMIPALIAITAASTTATVGTSIGTSVAQSSQANQTEEQQGKYTLSGAYVSVSVAAGNAPISIKP